MIFKKISALTWKDRLHLTLGSLGYLATLIFPQLTFTSLVSALGIFLFFHSFSFEKGGGVFLLFLGIWALDVLGYGTLIFHVGRVVGMIIPIHKCFSKESLSTKILWLGFALVFLSYIDGLYIQNPAPYWFLKSLIFPLSFSLCVLNWRKILAWSLKTGCHLLNFFSKNEILLLFLLSFCIVFFINFLEIGTFIFGLNAKHRIMYLSMVTMPFFWWLIDNNYKKDAFWIFGFLIFLNGYFQCRLGIIAIFFAVALRHLFLFYPKTTVWLSQCIWNIAAGSVTLIFQWIIQLKIIKKIATLNTSFYERLVFWRHFNETSDQVFWFGMGIGKFFQILLSAISYQNIEGVINTVPCHTHCLWLDLKLCFGCSGIIVSSVLLAAIGVKILDAYLRPFSSVTFGLCVYLLIIYITFFGIFSHFFVLSWVGFSWIVGKIFYCSTWNKSFRIEK
ncbi:MULTISPECIES: hypothetical protein [Holospora]|uniref:Uncharacterized protein n=2 Tax=Holospora TaxID=44747 RepID=A0A061JIT6_9PROT|nr:MULTISPECIES: hypothetical protein [Holospora]ETZ05129.1 hypothetical protein K737_300444 [Holospora undulata HU1]GAJ46328.1 hypothetical protein HE1_00659 [Holospora elegans E1]